MADVNEQEKKTVDAKVEFPPTYAVYVKQNEIDFPDEYNVNVSQLNLKTHNGARDFWLAIIAFALIALAIPAIYNFRLTLKTNQSASVVKSTSDDNIEQAKNTIYENGIIGIMLNNFDRSIKWSYFTSNTGHLVVNAEGQVDNPSKFLILTKNSSRISYSNRISELNSLTNTDVSKITFKIQFIKNIGSVYATEYNHFSLNTAELKVTMKNGTTKEINPDPTDFLDYIEAYLQDPSNF